jgi:hypothetical protein
MSGPILLSFPRDARFEVQLPEQCNLFLTGYESKDEVGEALAIALRQVLYALAIGGMDLRALDGITLTSDCREAAIALQRLPEGQLPSEIGHQPDTMEMARTVAVWRDKELRFHIVLRAGLGLMTLSPEKSQQALAYGCIAHEAAHVEHEGQLYRTLSTIYGRPLECGERSRQTFLKAMDVWSEYAACRSSAMFRPEAYEEFEGIFCRALEDSLFACKEHIATFHDDQHAPQSFREIQQFFGDVFICAGYFLGHLEGLKMKMEQHATRAVAVLKQEPQVEVLFLRLQSVLQELWLTKYCWKSVEVFAPIYDLISAMMALHGLVFAQQEGEWRIKLCDGSLPVQGELLF